jgi:hypothetical protein
MNFAGSSWLFFKVRTKTHILMIRVETATQKKLPTGSGPEGCDKNGPVAALLVG